MMRQKEELSDDKNARQKIYAVHPKGKRFQITGYCPKCYSDVKIDSNRKCMICHTKIKRKSTNEKLVKIFETMCMEHCEIMESWIPTTPETQHVFIKIKIGFYTYFVSIRYLIEFKNLGYSDDDDRYERFLKHIQKTCPRIAF